MPFSLLGCFGLGGSLTKVTPVDAANHALQKTHQASLPQDGTHQPLLHALNTARQLQDSRHPSTAAIVSCLDAVVGSLTHTAQLDSASRSLVVFHDISQLVQQLQSSCQQQGACIEDVGAATCGLLSILHEQWQQQQQQTNGLPTGSGAGPSNAFVVPAINDLLGALQVVLFQQVTLETPQTLAHKWQQYTKLQHAFGWQPQALAVVLNPANKALLLYLQRGQGAPSGERKVAFTVSRQQPFWQALQQAQHQGTILPRLAHTSSVGGQWAGQLQSECSNEQQGGEVCGNWCKVFPRFADAAVEGGRQVEAGEGHGPRKEFFLLAAQDMAAASEGPLGKCPALLVFNRTAGCYWLNSGLACSAQLQMAFCFVGWLMAQALCNRTIFGIPLAPLLCCKLLLGSNFQPSMQVLQSHDPDAATSILNVQKLNKKRLRDLVDVEGLAPSTSHEEYIEAAVRSVVVDDVAWQFEALQRGFCSVVSPEVFTHSCMSSEDLTAAICGTTGQQDNFDVRTVFRILVEDAEDSDEEVLDGTAEEKGTAALCSTSGSGVGLVQPLLECLWRVLEGWPHELRLAFVKFVTGSDRLPLPGTEALRISLPFIALNDREQTALLGTLPQAHTCENTLELPNYWEVLLMQEAGRSSGTSSGAAGAGLSVARRRGLLEECESILRDRLEMAIVHCNSYGLDEVATAAAALPAHLLPHKQQQEHRTASAEHCSASGMHMEASSTSLARPQKQKGQHAAALPVAQAQMIERTVSRTSSSSDEGTIITLSADAVASSNQQQRHGRKPLATVMMRQTHNPELPAVNAAGRLGLAHGGSSDDEDHVITIDALAAAPLPARAPHLLQQGPSVHAVRPTPPEQALPPGMADADDTLLAELMQRI